MFPCFHVSMLFDFGMPAGILRRLLRCMRQAVFRPYIARSNRCSELSGEYCSLPKYPLIEVSRDPLTSSSRPLYASTTLDSLLSDCIDQVLSELVGCKAKEALYDYMERNYAVAREDIPRNFSKFFTLTEEVCGKGSKTIARCVMKRLWQRLGWAFVDMPDSTFSVLLEITQARVAREVIEKAKASLTSEGLLRQ